MISHFPVTPPPTPIPHHPFPLPNASRRVLPHPPTLSCPTAPASPYSGASNLPKAPGPRAAHLLLSGKAILCYICSQCHGPLQVHSLVSGLDSGRTG